MFCFFMTPGGLAIVRTFQRPIRKLCIAVRAAAQKPAALLDGAVPECHRIVFADEVHLHFLVTRDEDASLIKGVVVDVVTCVVAAVEVYVTVPVGVCGTFGE